MIAIEETLISDDLISKKFVCHLERCKGACCVHGDAGAPLEKEELAIIEQLLPQIKPFMDTSYVKAIEENGFYEYDRDGDLVTTCQPTGECNFVVHKDGIAGCAIENAHSHGAIDYKKPISCHLYPVRIKKYNTFTAVNYDQWEICSPACSYGEELNVPVFRFLEESLTRKFGKSWFESLEAYYLSTLNPTETDNE